MSDSCRIICRGESGLLSTEELKKIASAVIGKHWNLPGPAPVKFQVDINIVNDRQIKIINKKYLKKDCPTDVIAFSFEEGETFPAEDITLLGQIIISADRAREQSDFYGNSLKEEMSLLIIHGMLHIAGWKEGEKIKECQKEILNDLL